MILPALTRIKPFLRLGEAELVGPKEPAYSQLRRVHLSFVVTMALA
jgi:hypothetical protein